MSSLKPGLSLRAIVLAVSFAGCLLGLVNARTQAALLDPTSLTKYIDPLPNPLGNILAPIDQVGGIDRYQVTMSQFTQQLHSELPATTVWGYNGTYPGPTFEVYSGTPIYVDWVNNLVDSGGAPLQQHLLPYDSTVHGAGAQFPEVRTVAHLHGGVVEPESDGYPEHWFTADPLAPANGMGGPAGNSVRYTYHNNQPSTTLWYHDHGMGITRLNVYAGLAGFYILRDEKEASLNLPSGAYEIPMVIQDRSFYDDGQLFYPRGPGDITDPGGTDPLAGLPPEFDSTASVVPHYVGDTNLVNGKVWPVMEVEPRKYRLRLLNGANSRVYDLQLDAGAAGNLTFHQIGSDGGLLASTTDRSQVLLSPAERADVIVDFSNLSVGDEVILRNFGPDGMYEGPDGGHAPADPDTTGQVMKFKIVTPTGPDTSSLPTDLVDVPRIPESEALVTRQLSLVQDTDEFGRPKLLLNGQDWLDPISERPIQGTTEIWEITNSTTDAHPVHLHLVQFQVLDRVNRQTGEIPLEPYEEGWKDTFVVNRRETVRVIARFQDFEGLYVWHCHILEHEDHEMMRPYEVASGPELVVEPGTTLAVANPVTVAAGNILTVEGTLSTSQVDMAGYLRGSGLVDANVNVANRGNIRPGGASVGTLTVDGDFTAATGALMLLDLGSLGSNDKLIVNGVTTLAGELTVRAVAGFDTTTLIINDSFDLFDFGGSVLGGFDVLNLPRLAQGLAWDTSNLLTTGRIVVGVGLEGDLNADGFVGIADLNIVLGNWNQNVTPGDFLLGDPSGDGFVGIADLNLVLGNWNAGTPPDVNANIPEPATWLVLAGWVFGVSGRKGLVAERRVTS